MNINAKQVTSIDVHNGMDNTTALGFFIQTSGIMTQYGALTAAMGSVWNTFAATMEGYDEAYAQARKWSQTAEINELDAARDSALSAFLNALKAMVASPNTTKKAAAKKLQFIRDKYQLSTSDEYMKETTAIRQMVQEVEATADAMTALTTTGLDDWFTDLKEKNEAFLAKMNERTAAQAGQEKGIVRDRRNQVELAYKNVVKLINAMAICEIPSGFDFTAPINLLNAEIEHYRQILARKGVSTGTQTDSGTSTDTTTPTDTTNTGDGGTTLPDDLGTDTSGGSNGGTDNGDSGLPADLGNG